MRPIETTIGTMMTASGAAMLATGIVLIMQLPETIGTKIADTCPADTTTARKCRAIYETKDEEYLAEVLDLAAGVATPANGTLRNIEETDPWVWSLSYRNRRGLSIALIVYGTVSLLSGLILLYTSLRNN
jgi:hypothetical protein